LLRRRLLVGVPAQRVLHRRIQPPARQRQPIRCGTGIRRRLAGERSDLAAQALEQPSQLQRPGLHVELKPLARPQPRDQASERGRELLALALAHDQRVGRADLQIAQECP
jgi:hypothetical protein